MSIETDAKKLVVLEKKKTRAEATLQNVNNELLKQRSLLEKKFTKIGLESSFS